MTLSGNKLAGGNPKDGRVDNDFYATDPKAVEMLLNILRNDLKYIPEDTEFYAPKLLLEPCVGEGHILMKAIQFLTTAWVQVQQVLLVLIPTETL